MAAPVSIVIPAHNQLEYCRLCVDSIHRHATRPFKLILVDNGSTDGVSEYFDSVPDADVAHSRTNRGFAGGVNLGLERAEGHVILLNSDTIVTPGWLERLERVFDDAQVGMAGPVTNYASGPQHIEGIEPDSIEAIDAYAHNRAEKYANKTQSVTRLVGFCLMIRDEVLQSVGKFDEEFGIGNFEDDDYCRRVREAGHRLCIAEDCFVFHFGHRTFQGMGIVGDEWEALMDRNADRYSKKWNEPMAERYAQLKAAAECHREALNHVDQRDWTAALEKLVQCITHDPTFHRGHNDMGAVLWELGQRDKAFEAFSRAVRLFPSDASARDNLRDAAEAIGRQAEAETILNMADTR